ncbi:MAG: pro-sigmaK processing inhibitor BofA family protein [Methanomicrobiales archaeon]|jgi:inhibitor of the pro-sigma K processing machinery|nr:pro-sigmaK processing inhibitor BofA family protein [Methanomicrobiales archaeon]
MLGSIVLILVVLVLIVVVYLVLRNIVKLLINSVLGLLILFITNYFHLMGYFGKPDIPISWLTVIVCALGGIIGAALLILLNLLGIPI